MDSTGAPALRNEPAFLRVASNLRTLAAGGLLAPGDRMPSIREVCRHHRVSPSTAMRAFGELERSGVVEARDRSGHYVLPSGARPPAPSMPPPVTEPVRVGISGEVETLFRTAGSPDIVQLGATMPDPDLLPAADLARHLAAAARSDPGTLTRYFFEPALPSLAAEICRRYTAQGCPLSPAEITVTAGGMEALNLAIRAVTRPGDIVAVESPGYFGLLEILESLGLRALPIPTGCAEGIDLSALRIALEEHPLRALVHVPSFSNPTGSCMSDARRKELAALLEDYGVPLVEDDVYGELYFGPARPRPVRTWAGSGDVLLCGSLSKCLGPGMRVGWVAGGRFTEDIRRLKHITSVSTPASIQSAAASYLRSNRFDRHLRQLRRSFHDQVCRARTTILRHFPAGTAVSDPSGGCFLWVQLPPEVDAASVQRIALARGISVAPGSIFSPSGGYRSFLRIGCGARWSPAIGNALATLGGIVREGLRPSLRSHPASAGSRMPHQPPVGPAGFEPATKGL